MWLTTMFFTLGFLRLACGFVEFVDHTLGLATPLTNAHHHGNFRAPVDLQGF